MTTRQKIWLTFAGILILTIAAGYIDWPGNVLDLNKIRIPFSRELSFRLGLDLQGGTHLVYRADLSNVKPEDYTEAMDGVRDVIERRVNAYGIAEPVVQTNRSGGEYRVIVELAGIKNIDEAIQMIGETPYMDFREEVSEPKKESNTKGGEEGTADKKESTKEQEIPIDLNQIQQPQFIPTKLSGKQFKRAEVTFDQQTGKPQVSLEFNDEGKKLFAEITARNVGKRVAIFLDGIPISAPVVQEPIRDGKAVITGDFSLEEAKQLTRRLNAGALPVPIKLISQQNIEASLGKISIEKSLIAGFIGLIAVALFMIIYYRLPGVLSVIALIIYALIVLALFKLIPVTLTLAGITGFILSVGMAVDANVLIFERMREELREGKDLNSAVEDGFKHAWNSIRDSNISSIITCIILGWFGTSIIKGFAITLGIGIIVSMFSAITVTRTFLRLLVGTRLENRTWLFGVKS